MSHYFVDILDRFTGEKRRVRMDQPYATAPDSTAEFLWTEGSWSCDCNRGLDFYRSDESVDEERLGRSCRGGRFQVLDVRLPDGSQPEDWWDEQPADQVYATCEVCVGIGETSGDFLANDLIGSGVMYPLCPKHR